MQPAATGRSRLSYLRETQHFLKLYMHMWGKSEVPPEYDLWCALSLIAACLENRVTIQKMAGAPMRLNLYTLLIGPSAIGKGTAIDRVMQLLHDPATEGGDLINIYSGKTTGAHLVQALGRQERIDGVKTIRKGFIWLIYEEMAASIGDGPLAQDFIRRMTAMYQGSAKGLKEGTNMRGDLNVLEYCVNWLAGTTTEWLHESVPKSAIHSGFFGRIIPVKALIDLNYRVAKPEVPHDHDEIKEYLRDFVKRLCRLEGPLQLTREAEALHTMWYEHRPSPTMDAMVPSWKRQDDMVYKVAGLLSLCKHPWDGWIRRSHMQHAIKLTTQSHACVPDLIRSASINQHTEHMWTVEQIMRTRKVMTDKQLAKAAAHAGVNTRQLQEAMQNLIVRDEVKVYQIDARLRGYKWVGSRRRVFKKEKAEA